MAHVIKEKTSTVHSNGIIKTAFELLFIICRGDDKDDSSISFTESIN